jgi:serine/threonine-protein kinase HipA
VNGWQQHFAQAGVSERDIASLAERLDGDALRSQRSGFDPARYRAAPARRKRPGPFQRR